MARLLLFCSLFKISLVFAAWDDFHFATEGTDFKCPEAKINCEPPKVCAYETQLDKYYCCSPEEDGPCAAMSRACREGDGEPGGGQILCGYETKFCCLEQREECTARLGEVKKCWSTFENPFQGIGEERMNETFSSLSSANPSATTFAIALEEVIQTPTPTSSPPQSTDPSAQSQEPSPSSTESTESSSSGMSGGAIGGVVVGVVAGLALIGGGAFILFRRNRNKKLESAPKVEPNPYYNNGYSPYSPPQEKYAHNELPGNQAYGQYPPQQHYPQPEQYPLVEMEGPGRSPIEMEGNHEVPSSRPK